MRSKTCKLKAMEDPATGDNGLVIEGVSVDESMPVVDTGGMVIAHDLIEHQNGLGRIGTIIDELEALGAILFVRGRSGELNRRQQNYHSVESNIGEGDLSRMFRDLTEYEVSRIPVTQVCDVDSEINRCIEYFSPMEGIESSDGELRRLVEPYKRLCRAHMRIGYRKVYRRWKGDWQAACTQYWAIADAVKPYSEHCEGWELYTLKYGEGRASVEERSDPYGY